MEEFYSLSAYFIDSLSKVGDFLMRKPLDILPDFMFYFMHDGKWPDFITDALWAMKGASVASWILGGSLTGILGYKLLKFYTDIVL